MSERKPTETNGKISARQEQLGLLLAMGEKDKTACKECKVGVTTLWRWKKLPAFMSRIEELRKEISQRGIDRLANIFTNDALNVLVARLNAKDEKGNHTASVADVQTAAEI